MRNRDRDTETLSLHTNLMILTDSPNPSHFPIRFNHIAVLADGNDTVHYTQIVSGISHDAK